MPAVKTQAKRDRNEGKVEKAFSNLPEKDQKALNDHMQDLVDQAREHFDKKFAERVKEDRVRCRKESVANNETQMRLDKAWKMLSAPFTHEEYKVVLGMLHSDKHEDPLLKDRADKAFTIFNRIEHLCPKAKPKKKKIARSAA